MSECEKIISRVLYTLEQVEVRGKQNLDKLLGCMQALEVLKDSLAAEKEAQQ